MDRQYATPRDVANASPEQIQRSLRRVLSDLQGPAEFLYESEFTFANGRKAPLLMVGGLRGAWRDHMRRNAASPRFAAGDCVPRRDADGRLVLELVAHRGRARGASHQRTINLSLMRGIGEVRFVDAPSSAPAPAAREAAAAPAAEAAAAAPVAAPAAPTAKAILAAFADFKTAPTMAKLDALTGSIAAWREAGGTDDPAGQIAKVAALLEQKGRAYVASKGG